MANTKPIRQQKLKIINFKPRVKSPAPKTGVYVRAQQLKAIKRA